MGLFLAAKCLPLPTNGPQSFNSCKKQLNWFPFSEKLLNILQDLQLILDSTMWELGEMHLQRIVEIIFWCEVLEFWERKVVDNKHLDFFEIYLLFDWKHKVNLGIGILCEVHKSPAALWVNCHWKLNKDWFKNITSIHIVPNWTNLTIYFEHNVPSINMNRIMPLFWPISAECVLINIRQI